jgi:hypothetical protein
MDRRAFLRLTGRVAVGGAVSAIAAACTSAANPGPSSPTTSRSASGSAPSTTTAPPTETAPGPPTEAEWNAFEQSLQGSLVRPNDGGYKVAHQLFDPLCRNRIQRRRWKGEAHQHAELVGQVDIAYFVGRSEHNHAKVRKFRLVTNPFQDVESIGRWHLDVEKDQGGKGVFSTVVVRCVSTKIGYTLAPT